MESKTFHVAKVLKGNPILIQLSSIKTKKAALFNAASL